MFQGKSVEPLEVRRMSMNKQPQQILVGESGPNVFIRLIGRGYFQNSAGLRQYLEEQILRKKSKIDLDLSECTGMDSTFMGLLAAAASHHREDPPPAVAVVNASPDLRNLLEGIGLTELLLIENDPFEDEGIEYIRLRDNATDTERLVCIRQAHEALGGAPGRYR